MEKERNIVLIGAAHLDRTGRLAAPSAMGCSNPGQFHEEAGGTSLNVAGVLSTLGQSPKLITQLGNDAAGAAVRLTAESRGVEVLAAIAEDQNTGTYTSLLEPDGNLVIALADMGIYDKASADLLDLIDQQIERDDIVCLDANMPAPLLQMGIACPSSMKIGFTVSKAKAPRLYPLLPALDLLFTNRVELSALFQHASAQQSFGSTDQNNKSPAAQLADLGIRNAVVSNGSKEVLVMENGETEVLPVSSASNIVDVTGAGDALAGGTLAALMDGAGLVDAVQFGIHTAGQIIQIAGPWRADLPPFLAN